MAKSTSRSMKVRYKDLIDQTFEFPIEGFEVKDNCLFFNGISLMDIIDQYGTPLKITYLPKISEQIQKAKKIFNVAMARADYKGKYTYCYCTKSSHFSFVLEEALKNDIHLETSSAFDIDIIKKLYQNGSIEKNIMVVCNGFKRDLYQNNIVDLIKDGFKEVIPVLDNMNELPFYEKNLKNSFKVGIRIATDEEPNFDFYTSRLGIRYQDIVPFVKEKILSNEKIQFKMLHFFINNGVKDNAYYWSELNKCINLYCELKKLCPELDTLDIGGGWPFRSTLSFDYDYDYIADEIIHQIKSMCEKNNVPEPNILTEFGSFTVGESGAVLYSVIDHKTQNDKENWYMIDSSFITTLPDTWGINQRFILLAINHWDKPYQRINLGGITCDSDDYYNMESLTNRVFLPERTETPLYVGFFHTGAYQESLGGYGGIQHCLIPAPKHVIIDVDEDGQPYTRLFAKEQSAKSMLKTLGY